MASDAPFYPASCLKIAATSAAKYPDSIDSAAEQAERAIRKLPEFAETVDKMVTQTIRSLIHEARHKSNIALRAGEFGGPAKVGLSTGAANRVIVGLLDSYVIAGRCLGSLVGSELLGLRDAESERATGLLFNAAICEALAPLVPADKTVRECVSEAKVKAIFKTIQAGGTAAVLQKPKASVPTPANTNGRAIGTTTPTKPLPGRKPKVRAVARAT